MNSAEMNEFLIRRADGSFYLDLNNLQDSYLKFNFKNDVIPEEISDVYFLYYSYGTDILSDAGIRQDLNYPAKIPTEQGTYIFVARLKWTETVEENVFLLFCIDYNDNAPAEMSAEAVETAVVTRFAPEPAFDIDIIKTELSSFIKFHSGFNHYKNDPEYFWLDDVLSEEYTDFEILENTWTDEYDDQYGRFVQKIDVRFYKFDTNHNIQSDKYQYRFLPERDTDQALHIKFISAEKAE